VPAPETPVVDRALALSKHEGAGNDFLVVLDPEGTSGVGAAAAVQLCDRHRGIGADGLIVVGPASGGADLTMTLYNADGGIAEMSGNGIRCLAQAAVEAGLVEPDGFTVSTGAGVRTVHYRKVPGGGWASVDMGPVSVGPEEPSPLAGWRARHADAGNPHLVLLGEADPESVDLLTLGEGANAAVDGGVNVEVVCRRPEGGLRLRVFERGVGETLACGTGSCAAAAAARRWGVVGDTVPVENPGGLLEVQLGRADGDPVVLSGPVRRIADVVVEPATAAAAR
jgi:diaminopimelate epimerase